MNNIFLILIAICIFYIFFSNNKEQFTEQDTVFARELVNFFQQNPNTDFITYLDKLNELKNTSDNLISKGVFKKFLTNNSLTINDVLSAMSE
jgi:hypothetical protein